MRSDKAVNSPQGNKDRTFHVHMLMEAYVFWAKMHFPIALKPQDCSQFALNFPPNFRLMFL